jgi:hypothetical protein
MKEISIIATNACGWPNLTKLQNGRILCTYFNAPSHGLMGGDLVCSISNKKGDKWKKHGIVSPGPKGGNQMHLAVGLACNGDLLTFSSGFYVEQGKFVGFTGQRLSRSKDGGQTWETDLSPSIPKDNKGAIPFGRIIQFENGKLAYSCYRTQGVSNPSESWITFSNDDGLTWGKRIKFGRNDSNESTLCPLDDGRILAATRTHIDHHVKLCESLNSGKNWKELGPLTLPMQHPADLISLTQKCLLMTYGIRNRGLMGIGVRLSLDAGKTWRPPWVIHQFGNKAKDVGYPSTVLIDNKGSFLTAAYTDYEQSYRNKAKKYRVITKKWNLKDWLHESFLEEVSDGKKLNLA